MEEQSHKREVKDTEEMVQWRCVIQEEMNNVWKNVNNKIKKRRWRSTKVDESKRGAFKGRGEPLEWRIAQRV